MITITIMMTVTASKWNLERKKKKSVNGLVSYRSNTGKEKDCKFKLLRWGQTLEQSTLYIFELLWNNLS